MTTKQFNKFLKTVPEYLHSAYTGAAQRGYYDKEKYRRTAKADRSTSQPEDQDPPQC